MNVGMHGKAIKKIYFDGSGIGNEVVWLEAGDFPGVNRSLSLSATHHGDHDEFWVVEKLEGKEVARHSVRNIANIIWLPVSESAL